jgi:DNA-binding XRE family transcriptional regulator
MMHGREVWLATRSLLTVLSSAGTSAPDGLEAARAAILTIWLLSHIMLGRMGTKAMTHDFDALLEQIDREAKAEGPQAVAALHALQVKYRMLNQIIEARRALRLTQKDLAEKAGLGQAEVSKIERGRKSPTLDTYSRLAAALDLEVPGLARRRHPRNAA